jgi:hypothetical protein
MGWFAFESTGLVPCSISIVRCISVSTASASTRATTSLHVSASWRAWQFSEVEVTASLAELLVGKVSEGFGVMPRSSYRCVEDHRLRWFGVVVRLLDGDFEDLATGDLTTHMMKAIARKKKGAGPCSVMLKILTLS